ncbi:MAG: TiaS agmantine-binding domain-containing protein [Infirmifilum sp.]
MQVHIGVDDTDSPQGFCTTFLGFLLTLEFKRLGLTFLDLPYLVRLNPNVPFKTRGNAAISLHLEAPNLTIEEVVKLLSNLISKYSEKHGKTSPGFVVVVGEVNEELRKLYSRTLREVVPLSYVKEQIKKGVYGEVVVGGIGRGRGLVGALAAVGAYPLEDYTYELLLYRDHMERETSKLVDEEILIEFDRKHRPLVFATYDYVEKRLLAVPRGADPVLLGVRSLSPRPLLEFLEVYASRALKSKPVGYIIYKTNQATNSHLHLKKQVGQVRPYDSVVVEGVVKGHPKIIESGHVVVELCDGEGCVEVMFYRETGRLNRVARLLRPSDRIEVGGGIIPRKGLTLNGEYVRIISLQMDVIIRNPICPRCGARMKSAGKGKGYKCPKCGYRAKTLEKSIEERPRILEPGLYVPSMRAYRHLTRPREIIGLAPEPLGILLSKGVFASRMISLNPGKQEEI